MTLRNKLFVSLEVLIYESDADTWSQKYHVLTLTNVQDDSVRLCKLIKNCSVLRRLYVTDVTENTSE